MLDLYTCKNRIPLLVISWSAIWLYCWRDYCSSKYWKIATVLKIYLNSRLQGCKNIRPKIHKSFPWYIVYQRFCRPLWITVDIIFSERRRNQKNAKPQVLVHGLASHFDAQLWKSCIIHNPFLFVNTFFEFIFIFSFFYFNYY